MNQEGDKLRELHKSIRKLEDDKESRSWGTSLVSGCLVYPCFFGFLVCMVAFMADFDSKWIWFAVTVGSFAVIVLVYSITNYFDKKSDKKIEELKEETFASIIDKDSLRL